MSEYQTVYHYSGASKTDIDGRSATEHRVLLRFVKLIGLVAVCVPFVLAWFLFYSPQMRTPYHHLGNCLILFLYAAMFYLIAHLYHGFLVQISAISEIIYAQALSACIADFLIYIVIWLLIFRVPNIPCMLLVLGCQILVICGWAYWSHQWYFRHYPPKKTIVLYDEDQNLDNLVRETGMRAHFQVERTLNIREVFPQRTVDYQADAHHNAIEDQRIRNVIGDAEVVFLYGLHSHDRNQIVKYCVANDVAVYLIPRIGDVIMAGAEKMHLFHLPMLRVAHYNPTPEYLFFKRLFDILLSGTALVILSPLMIVLALIIRSDGGTAFYRQKRLTRNGRVFEVLKFRSMRMDAEKDGVARLSTGEKDPRITKVGHFIRACRMDELPQLINILKGDMSIVGPRPERPEIAAQYKEFLPEFDLRLQCKCGLTGYAQVYGKYNTTPYDKLLLDLMYIAKPSLAEDFKICLATVKILFMKDSTEGVAEGQTTASAESLVNTEVPAEKDAEKESE